MESLVREPRHSVVRVDVSIPSLIPTIVVDVRSSVQRLPLVIPDSVLSTTITIVEQWVTYVMEPILRVPFYRPAAVRHVLICLVGMESVPTAVNVAKTVVVVLPIVVKPIVRMSILIQKTVEHAPLPVHKDKRVVQESVWICMWVMQCIIPTVVSVV